MKTILKTAVIAIAIFAMTIGMSLGVTIQRWTNIFTPLEFSHRAILLGLAGLILVWLSVRTSRNTLLSILHDGNIRLINDFRLIGMFSLIGFGFGLLASALTLLIWLL